MTKDTKIYIGAGVAVLIIALIIGFSMQKSAPEPTTNENNENGKVVTESKGETFSGTISAVDTGCFVDAVCSVTIDGKKVILVQGGRAMAGDTNVGKLMGVESIGDLEQNMGAYANVYAAKTPGGDYTLYGNTEYYVEVVTISGK
jgi:hypothetical protein